MTSPRLQMPELAVGQEGKELIHNAAIRILDALAGAVVQDRDLATPPGSPVEGALYIVAAGGAGDWSGESGNFAHYYNGSWWFYPPTAGFLIYLVDEDTPLRYDGADWAVPPGGGDFLASGAVPMAGPLDMAGFEITEPVLTAAGELEVENSAATGAVDLDYAEGNVHTLTLVGDTTLSFINAPPTGVAAALTIVLEQDVTGGHTVTWPGSLLWAGGAAPTLSSAGGSVDVVVAVRLADLWLGGVYGVGFA
jgi:hypothetical protein